jgi:RNA polymerase sigma factor (sigma-70 family)
MPWDGVYALVERARAGDRSAWTDLHALAADYLLGLAQKLLGPGWPHESAHDLAQDVWLKFCETISEFRGGADDAATAAVLRAWLGRTATQLAKNCVRDNRAQKRAAPAGTVRLGTADVDDSRDGPAADPPARDPSPSYAERLREWRATVQRALGRLPDPADRVIVDLHYVQGWPLRRIVNHLNATQQTPTTYDKVRYRLGQIRDLLKDELRSLDGDLAQP